MFKNTFQSGFLSILWWVDLDKILATIAADDLKQKLQAFEEAQKATGDEAIAAAMERKEEAAAADD